jgi:hypothetical protein
MATIEEIAAGLRSGTPVQKPTTATQTFDPKYINSYGGLVSGATNPNLAANLNKYGTVTDAYGNPIFDQNTLSSYYSDPSTLDKSTKAISSVAGKAINTGLTTWADEVLQKETLDPVTGNPVNWVGGFGGAQYKAAKTALMANPTNNVRWTTQKTQAQTIADQAVADAKTEADAKIAADAKVKADADAKIQADAATKLATEQDTANQLAQQTANDLKLKNATAPLDTKTLGGGFDALGNPINSTVTSGITQDMIDKGMLNVAKVGAPTTIVNPNSAADVTKMVDAAKASEVNVTPDSMVSNQLSGLLAKNNPYIQRAVNAANLQASRRGMLNTGAAAGFAQDAAIKAALPIAQQDALARQKANEANAAAQNQLLNTGLGLKATSMDRQAQNDIQVQNWNAANKITVDTTNTQAINAATNLFTTAILNDLNNLATSNRDSGARLRELISKGNIEIAGKVTQSVIDSVAADTKFESDKKLAVFNETLKQQTNQLTAENQVMVDALKGDRETSNAVLQAHAVIDGQLLDAIKAINLTPDMNEKAKAANANGLTMMANAMKKNITATAAAQSQLINSDAGKTATSLVSPTNK